MLRSIGVNGANTGVRKWAHVPITIEETVGPAEIFAPEMCEYDMRITFGRKLFCRPKEISDLAKLMRQEVGHFCFDQIKQDVRALEIAYRSSDGSGSDRAVIAEKFNKIYKDMEV